MCGMCLCCVSTTGGRSILQSSSTPQGSRAEQLTSSVARAARLRNSLKRKMATRKMYATPAAFLRKSSPPALLYATASAAKAGPQGRINAALAVVISSSRKLLLLTGLAVSASSNWPGFTVPKFACFLLESTGLRPLLHTISEGVRRPAVHELRPAGRRVEKQKCCLPLVEQTAGGVLCAKAMATTMIRAASRYGLGLVKKSVLHSTQQIRLLAPVRGKGSTSSYHGLILADMATHRCLGVPRCRDVCTSYQQPGMEHPACMVTEAALGAMAIDLLTHCAACSRPVLYIRSPAGERTEVTWSVCLC